MYPTGRYYLDSTVTCSLRSQALPPPRLQGGCHDGMHAGKLAVLTLLMPGLRPRLQVYLVNVTINIMECKAELAPGPNPSQALLPVWCALLVELASLNHCLAYLAAG